MASAARFLRKSLTVIAAATGALVVVLAVVTAAGTYAIERGHPPPGRFVDVEGGRLHIVERGPADAPAVVLLHGATANLGDPNLALGDRLGERYRVILVDRPGHGWSDRPGGRAAASPARQAELIHQALTRIGVTRPIVVGHSWSGALAPAYALAFPDDVAALVLLAPVTHPWPGGVGLINELAAAPVIGQLIARTVVLPAGYLMMTPALHMIFAPQTPPADYVARTGARLVLRPAEFIANAEDLVDLKANIAAQAPRYGEIKAPVAIIAGDKDTIVSTDIHARVLARQLPDATLTVLPGVGHMVNFAAAERIVQAVDAMAGKKGLASPLAK